MPAVKRQKRPLQPHFLAEWREFRGLTQEQAAPRLNISRSQLSKIENRIVPYNQAFMELAAEAYTCTVADLVMRNPLDETAPWSIVDNLKKATPKQQRLAAAMIAEILKSGT